MRTEAAHRVTVPYHPARSAIGALDARICFSARSRRHKDVPRREICTTFFFFFRLQYYGCIYHLLYAICSRQNPTNARSPQRKTKPDDHINIPFTVWETSGRTCISCSNFHHTHTALSITLSAPYYKKYLAYKLQTQPTPTFPFYVEAVTLQSHVRVPFLNLYY